MKDQERIKNIIDKSNGNVEKEKSLAQQMANKITDWEKAIHINFGIFYNFCVLPKLKRKLLTLQLKKFQSLVYKSSYVIRNYYKYFYLTKKLKIWDRFKKYLIKYFDKLNYEKFRNTKN